MTAIELSDDELVLLDGRCNVKAQNEVDRAKARIDARRRLHDVDPAIAGFVADAVSEATQAGKLTWTTTRARRCDLHGEFAGYVTYKSGPRRGKPNYDRPLTFPAIELAHRFVRVEHLITLGGCQDCVTAAQPLLVEALSEVRAELPKQLRSEGRPVYVRYDRRCCTKCGWSGHEGEMGRLRTLMGDGTYPGKCPACGAEQMPLHFPSIFERVEGFDVVEAPA